MANVRIEIDTSVGKTAEFRVDDALMSYGHYDDRSRALLDDVYRQAWLSTLKQPQDRVGES